MSELKIKLVRSRIGIKPKQKRTLDALGLTRREMVKTIKDNAAMRGMINQVQHLIEVIES